MFNPYQPSIFFVGHMQTVQTQIRCHDAMSDQDLHCLQNVCCLFWFFFEREKKERILSNTLKIRNKPVLLIMVGKSIRLKWVKVGTDDVCMSESFQD